jgi:hypothetical protein
MEELYEQTLCEWESGYRSIIDAMVESGNDEGKKIVKEFLREVYIRSTEAQYG